MTVQTMVHESSDRRSVLIRMNGAFFSHSQQMVFDLNKVLQDQTPSVSPAELLLSRETRRTLAQLRTNKSPLLVSYLFSIGDPRHPSPLCPLCLMHDHTSSHLFECKSLPTSLSSLDLWTNPDKVEPFLATWGERLLAAT